jgi:hypothetical protein
MMMSKMVLTACTAVVLVALLSGMAFAGLPCEGTSTVVATGSGFCAGVPGAALCPNGDYDVITVTVTVRDCYGDVLPGKDVVVWAYSDDEFCYCPDGEPTPYELEDTKLAGTTDAAGMVTAEFKKIGGCGQMKFYATVEDVVLGPSNWMRIASFDFNPPDCVVNLSDFGEFAKVYFSSDPCGDYNCDGAVNLSDFGEFAKHYFHDCVTP